MTTPVDIDPLRTYQDIYARLVDLCERPAEFPDDSHLYVMEAFTHLTEVDLVPPTKLPAVHYGRTEEALHQVRRLLTDLISSSSDLQIARALLRVDACIEGAIAERQ